MSQLREDMNEQNRQLREDMNLQFAYQFQLTLALLGAFTVLDGGHYRLCPVGPADDDAAP